MHPIFHDIAAVFEHYPDRVALVEKDGRRITYGEFKAQILGAQKTLQEKGIHKGSKVLVFVPMSLELYAILEALLSIGATAVFLDPWMGGKKMSAVIRQIKPDLFIATPRIARLALLLPATWPLRKWKVARIEPQVGDWTFAEVSDHDAALITFTSGTSGAPKGTRRDYAFLRAQSESLKKHLAGTEHSVDYTNFPIAGLACFELGNTLVIPQLNLMRIHEAEPLDVAAQIKAAGCKRLIVSPSLLERAMKGLQQEEITGLRHIITGGAPVSRALLEQCEQSCKNAKLEVIYGSTEAEPIAITTFSDMLQQSQEPLKGIFVGPSVEETKVRILKPHSGPMDASYFEQNVLAQGEIGEIVVTGDHVSKAYYENERAFLATKIVDKEGQIWHRTGDIGYFSEEGIYLVGRDHRIMNYGERKLYPYPVEAALMQHFGLSDVGYVQLKNGSIVCFLGGGPKLNPGEVQDYLRELNFPCDEVRILTKPLPRDARHRSKLQIEELL